MYNKPKTIAMANSISGVTYNDIAILIGYLKIGGNHEVITIIQETLINTKLEAIKPFVELSRKILEEKQVRK